MSVRASGGGAVRAMRASWSLLVLLATLLVLPAPASAVGPVTHLGVSSLSGTEQAGGSVLIGVIPQDASNTKDPSFTGTIHFSSSDPLAVLPPDTTTTGGIGVLVTLKTAGNQTVTAALTSDPSIAGTSGPVLITPLSATHFSAGFPLLVPAGAPFTFTVTARDMFNNRDTGFSRTVHFTSSDASATLPADAQLTGGSRSFTATLRSGGAQTITATDTLLGPPFAVTIPIAVARPATHLQLTGPESVIAGFPALVGVRALDANGATASTYAGTVHFSSSDQDAGLPDDVKLANGNATVLVAFGTPGSQTIAAADTAIPGIAGTSKPVVVGFLPPLLPPPPPGGGTASPPPAPPPPAIRGLAVKPLCVTKARLLSAPKRGRGALAISFTLSAGARVSVALERLVHAAAPARCPRSAGSTKGAVKLVRTLSGTTVAGGRSTLAIAARAGGRVTIELAAAAAAKPLAPGAYLVRVRATDAAGRRSALATAKFFVRR